MIPLHGLWSKSNNRTRGQFEYDVALFFIYLFIYLFIFDFVRSHAQGDCYSINCLCFQVMQKKGRLQNEH